MVPRVTVLTLMVPLLALATEPRPHLVPATPVPTAGWVLMVLTVAWDHMVV